MVEDGDTREEGLSGHHNREKEEQRAIKLVKLSSR